MKRIVLLTLFAATLGKIARLRERNKDEDLPFARLGLEDGTRFAKLEPTDEDVDLPFARLGLEDGTRFAKLKPADEDVVVPFARLVLEDGTPFEPNDEDDEDQLLVEVEPVRQEDDIELHAELDSYEEGLDESHSDPEIIEVEENGKKSGRACGRMQRRKLRRRNRMMKKIQKNGGDVELTEEVPLFSKIKPSEAEVDALVEELNVFNEKEEEDNEEEEEILIQSGGRHRFRQRRNQGGNRGEKKRVRLSRRLLEKLRTATNHKTRRIKNNLKNNEEKIKKVHDENEDRENNHGKRHGRKNRVANNKVGRHFKGGRRLEGAAGGCKESSKICCDGSAPSWKRSTKNKKMTCEDGEKPLCDVTRCNYTVLDYFVSLI